MIGIAYRGGAPLAGIINFPLGECCKNDRNAVLYQHF